MSLPKSSALTGSEIDKIMRADYVDDPVTFRFSLSVMTGAFSHQAHLTKCHFSSLVNLCGVFCRIMLQNCGCYSSELLSCLVSGWQHCNCCGVICSPQGGSTVVSLVPVVALKVTALCC